MTSSSLPVNLQPMYETEEGLEFVGNPDDHAAIQRLISADKLRLAFHFQTVDCACIYGLTKKSTWEIDIEVYKYLQKNPYSRRTILKLLNMGHFDIGVILVGSYHVIKEITSYISEENSEIVMHYSYPRTKPGNVAWRSVKWDLFSQMVNEINEDDLQLETKNKKVYLKKQITEL